VSGLLGSSAWTDIHPLDITVVRKPYNTSAQRLLKCYTLNSSPNHNDTYRLPFRLNLYVRFAVTRISIRVPSVMNSETPIAVHAGKGGEMNSSFTFTNF
jgi:hypothetical protein